MNEPTDPVPENRKPVPDYFSRPMKIKLFTLVGLLLVVLVLMMEARKPENWEWMGFRAEPPSTIETDLRPEGESAEFRTGSPDSRSPSLTDPVSSESEVPSGESSVGEGSPRAQPESEDSNVEKPFGFNPTLSLAAENPMSEKMAAKFWIDVFQDLDESGKRILFRSLRHLRHNVPLPESHKEEVAGLFKRIIRQREDFHLSWLGDISTLSDSAVEKPELNRQYFESRKLWETSTLPALQSLSGDGDITMQQLSATIRLQLTLDEFAFRDVRDRTPLNNPREGLAWLRCWENVLAGDDPYDPVTHIQLSGQPSTFRGRRVSVDGKLLRARRLRMARNELGLQQYYELWLLPADTSLSPYCVLTTSLPDGISGGTGATVEMSEPVTVKGVFFKNRSYQAAQGDILYCPLLLAKTVVWNPDSQSDADGGGWWPNWQTGVLGFVLMPLLAGYLAWRAYSITNIFRRGPSKSSRETINSRLGELEKDSDIMTDAQRVQLLYQDENLTGESGDR